MRAPGRIAAAVLALICLALPASAHPAARTTGSAPLVSTPAPAPGLDRTPWGDPTVIPEQLMRQMVVDSGEIPVGDAILAYWRGTYETFLWQTTTQALCDATYDVAPSTVGCASSPNLPTGPAPALEAVFSGSAAGGDWLTVFIAANQEVHSLTCDGVRTELSRVGQISSPDGRPLTVYTYVVPWLTSGTLQAEVARPDGVTVTEPIDLDTEFLNVQRSYIRHCDQALPQRPVPDPGADGSRSGAPDRVVTAQE